MDTNLQRGMLDSVDMSSTIHHLQGDIGKLNTSVLRGIEGGTLHFITVPRSENPEFIDHSLLSPEYITAQIQNGLVVDIIRPSGDGAHEQSQAHIYHTQGDEQERALIERQYMQEVALAATSQAQLAQDLPSSNGSVIIEDPDRRLAAAFLQYVQKEAPQLITNETQVIVSNKEIATLAPISDAEKQLHVAGNFVTSIENDQLINQHFLHENSAIKLFQTTAPTANAVSNNITNIPPLPPLTPISKLQNNRRPREVQQIIQYKSSVDLPSNMFKKVQQDEHDFSMCSVNGDQQQFGSMVIAPKKTLPHKKRITKKLKSINQDDVAQVIVSSMNGNQQEFVQTPQPSSIHLTNAKNDARNLPNFQIDSSVEAVHQSPVAPQPTSTPASMLSSQYSCELCGLQCNSQLDFFSHLKQHYEPPSPMPDKSVVSSNCLATTNANRMELANMINVDPMTINNARTVINESFTILSGNADARGNQSNDDDSVDGINNDKFDTVKSEENEFSDTEDMLEGGVVDKVQNAVDNYIENNSNEVNDLMTLSNAQNQINIAIDGEEKDWYQTSTMPNNIVFQPNELADSKVDGAALLINDNSLSSQHSAYQQQQATSSSSQQQQSSHQSTPGHVIHEHQLLGDRVIEQLPTVTDGSEMTVIYEISEIDNKAIPEGYTVVDQNGQSILRRELLKPPIELLSNYQVMVKNESDGNYSFSGLITAYPDEDDPSEEAVIEEIKSGEQRALSLRDIQDEFIEEEKTESDSERLNGTGPRKKKKFFRCKRCNKLCNSKNALHYHFLSHTGERPHQCEICGKSFFASSALKVHKRLHSGDKPYECNHCGRHFRQWGDLRYHIQSRHTTEKNHQCEFCGKDFARRYSLVIHRRIHTGEKNYKCEFCDKEFRASSYLQVHRKIHTGEKPHACTVCGKKFRVRGDLKRHASIHERDNKAKADKMNDLDLESPLEASSSTNDNSKTNDSSSNQMVDMAKIAANTANKFTNGSSQIIQSAQVPNASSTKPRKRTNTSVAAGGTSSTHRSRAKPKKTALIDNALGKITTLQLIKNDEPLELLHKIEDTAEDGNSSSATPKAMTPILQVHSHEQIGGANHTNAIVVKDTDLEAQQQFISWPIVSYMS